MNDKYVTSRTLSERLKAAGYPQNTQFYFWVNHLSGKTSLKTEHEYHDWTYTDTAAPLSDELLAQLPGSIPSKQYTDGKTGEYREAELWQRKNEDGKYFVWYFVNGIQDVESEYGCSADKPADALAKLWLWCAENGYIK